jgi:PAS domain S-box-containing protein
LGISSVKWTTERNLLAGFWVGLLVILANGVVAVWSLQSILRNVDDRTNASEIVLALESRLSVLKDAEAGQRGFVITGRPGYLAPFTKAEAQLRANENALRALMRPSGRKAEKLDRLLALSAIKMAELRRGIDLRRQVGFEAAQALVHSGRGENLAAELRLVVDQLRDEQSAALEDLRRRSRNAIRHGLIGLSLASIVGAVLLGLIVRMTRRDLIARRAADESLRKSEAWLSTTLNAIGDAVIATDEQGRVVFMNRVAEQLTASNQAQASGRTLDYVFNIVNEVTRQSIENPVARVLRENGVVGQADDLILLAADGREIPIDDSVAPIRNENGEIIGVVLVFRDVTERRAIVREIVHDRDSARNAVAVRDEFLAMLSHELRTPLNPVLLATSAMLDHLPEERELRSTLEMVYRNIELEARLIDDLLDVTRIRRGKLIYHFSVVNAHDVINRALAICEADADAGGIVVTADLNAERSFVNADPGRLQQVVWNLVKNAVKFTRSGRRVTVRTRNVHEPSRSSEAIEIEVADEGIGIAPDLLPRLFNAFQQGDGESQAHIKGLGLGLAISRAVVEAHQGTISARSAGKGAGATFLVRLGTVAAPSAAPNPRSVPPPAAASTNAKRRILLVEDDPDTRNILSRLLRLDGHEIVTADRCESARESWSGQAFDLLITDIGLPDGNGWDMIRQLRSVRCVPAIALTGFGMEQDMRRSREEGFLVHLTKPIDFSKLRDAIRDAPREQA